MDNTFKFYKKEKKKDSFIKRFLFNILIKSLIVIALFLICLIYIRQSSKNKINFKNIVYNNSISFARIYNLYSKYLGDVIPFKDQYKDNTKVVSSDKIVYSDIKKDNNGYVLTVSKEYATPCIKSGIVIDKKKSNKYKTIIKIQDKNGLVITYGYLDNLEVSLYDYVEKGEILGNVSDKLYLMFEKDNKYLSYEEYL